MGDDEAGTLRRYNALRRDIVEPLIARHRGRVVIGNSARRDA
jgi:hypothetical protein